jgi:CRP/FNR family transcriptional regulator, cyclic AMP receptor protein
MALAATVVRDQHGGMKTKAAGLLEATWFADGMVPDVLDALAAIGRVADFAEGAVVVRPDEPCPALGVIVHGRIAIRPPLAGSVGRTILTLEDGDIFGWSAVLPGSTATSTAIAIAPTRAVLIEREDLARAFDSDPRVAAAVYQRVLSAVARRLQSTRMQLLDLYRAGDEPW